MRFLVAMLATLCLSLSAQATVLPSALVLYSGDVRVLKAPGVERVAVGNVELISATLLKNEEVVLTAQKDGETTMLIWFEDGSREQMSVVVAKANGYRQLPELRAMLADIPGVRLRTVGRQVVIEGRLSSKYLEQVKEAAKAYDNVIVLAEEQQGAASKSDAMEVLSEVQAMLGNIPGISIKAVGRQIVIDGSLDAVDMTRIEVVKQSYPDVLVLAQLTSEYDAPMVYFDVRVTEFSKDYTESLGIIWDDQINGPSWSLASDQRNNKYFRGQFPSSSGTLAPVNGLPPAVDKTTGLTASALAANSEKFSLGTVGYWGIATEITSRINLLEKDGAALTLASPRLSARSGGTAQLTVGGQTPVVTSSISGPSVEYKDYGVMLNIAPKVYGNEQISTKVSAEISQVDMANQVSGYPAFKTRRTENDVQLRLGETLVLSGLISTENAYANQGIPFLRKMPWVGRLFGSDSGTEKRTELVIFITPRLMTAAPDSINAQELQRNDELLKRYQEKAGAIELID
jgi:Flp pilus assembly secretin CpaC